MDKRSLLDELTTQIRLELDRSTRRAEDAAAAATHEENKPEGDKDMRSTEASYIARGQVERVRDLEASLLKLGAMALLSFERDVPIQSSAVVDVELEGKGTTRYFVVTAGGGAKLAGGVVTLATTSPLGRALLGATEGDEVDVTTPQGPKTYTVVRVR